jgi:hypothetical protein
MRRNTPPDFAPPYDAYEAKYTAERKSLACCFLGVQDRGGRADEARSNARELLGGFDGAAVVEQGWHDDTAGARTYVYMAYWRDVEHHRRWLASEPVATWLRDALGSPLVGRYLESAIVPPRGLDTLIADPEVSWGLSKLADRIELTPYHAYWGGTRDRILDSEHNELRNPGGPQLPKAASGLEGIGEIVDVLLPHNAVVARGGPDWSKCPEDELREFRSSVYPAYVRGGRYLRDNADEAGCYAACLVQETDAAGGDVPRNHLIAYFSELSRLEKWTRSHPTHLEIFGRFNAMVRKLDGRMPAMNLYHEVAVIPRGGLTATYANCLPLTGLLRFGAVRR